jgi:hypothetical protein
MVAMKYDMKAYLRMLLNTQAFARASTKEVAPGVPYYFEGPGVPSHDGGAGLGLAGGLGESRSRPAELERP